MSPRSTLSRLFLPAWTADKRPDPNHFYRRRFTRRHRAKRDIVKNVWIAAGMIALCLPQAAFVAIVGLTASFVSFMILDETR